MEQPLPFENSEYELRISGTIETDKRIMSFFDLLWGFEVTGGFDQFEPLTVIDVNQLVSIELHKHDFLYIFLYFIGIFQVSRAGYAFRAGIRRNDIIFRINNIFTDDMTLIEAQKLIKKSGKSLQLFVTG